MSMYVTWLSIYVNLLSKYHFRVHFSLFKLDGKLFRFINCLFTYEDKKLVYIIELSMIEIINVASVCRR